MAANRVAVPMADLKQLEIVTREQGTTTTIELAGEWDLAGARAVRQAMASALTARPECVMLDLSQLAFIDSTGLHATVELAQRAGAENIRLVIIPGPRAVQRVFEITGVAARLPFNDEPPPGLEGREIPHARNGAAGSGGRSLPPHRAWPPPQGGQAPNPHSAGRS